MGFPTKKHNKTARCFTRRKSGHTKLQEYFKRGHLSLHPTTLFIPLNFEDLKQLGYHIA